MLSWVQGEVIKVVVMDKRGGNQTCCRGYLERESRGWGLGEMELRVCSNIMILFLYILLLLIWHMYLYIIHC